MLMDMFPARGRGLAIGMFYVSANLGAVVAAAAGGYLAEHHGWRTALFVAGAPGIFAALLLFFTVDEPRRGEMEEEIGRAQRLNSVTNAQLVCRILLEKKNYKPYNPTN